MGIIYFGLLEFIFLCNGLIGLVLSDDALGFGLGMYLGFTFLVFVDFMENKFKNVGLIWLSMGLGSVFGPCLFVVDFSGGEVCLEVWPGLVRGRFVIPFFLLRWRRCVLLLFFFFICLVEGSNRDFVLVDTFCNL